MGNPLLVVDLDGTLKEPLSGNKFSQHPRDQKIIEKADLALKSFSLQGWQIFGLSNEGGVEAGYKSLSEAIEESFYSLELFPELEGIIFCPDLKGELAIFCFKENFKNKWKKFYRSGDNNKLKYDFFRKPGIGGFQLIYSFLSYTPREIIFVGDREEDLQAAENAGVAFIEADFWRENYNLQKPKKSDFAVSNILLFQRN